MEHFSNGLNSGFGKNEGDLSCFFGDTKSYCKTDNVGVSRCVKGLR